MDEYVFYMYLLTFVLIGMVGIPLTVGFLLRKTKIWNGVLAMISMLLAIVALLLAPGVTVEYYLEMTYKSLWLAFASWTLVLSIFGIIDDRYKAIPIVAISTLAGIIIMITILV